ncbi:trafficking protein particle complex subunit 9-like protein [Leptotrombidium deliense]|uniref:Trafficking protein particle complex subunit 9-like protein n=1 Tax=Leptotrombidium deliense TaxID=299467 RepID=A0A443SC44_9ACAR|nr:trafficking protein particle complex subunit 9-like protein [Leptotrombidium deliense]
MKRRSSLQRNSSLPASKFRKMQEEASNVESKTRSFNRKFLLAGAGSSRSLPNGDPIVAKAMGKFLLNSITEVYERYKEACCHYAKYRNASVVELECSFKASRLLTFHEKYLYASEFIQNAVFISFNQSPDEQIKRLCIISDLYSDIGYNRKSAFYQRFAALKAVAINVQNPNWKQCYHLLLPSLDGYNLTLDPVEYDKRVKQREFGWTGIHLQLLQELVTTAKRMSAEQVAIRHLSFLLHALFEFLTPNQRKDFAKQLETLSQNCGEGAPVPLTLSTGIIIPSVNLTKFPCVTSFKVQNLSPRLNPVQLKSKHRESISSPASPFIFTPLQLSRPSSARRKSATITAQPLNFKWIEGEVGRVLLKVHNYLPIDLSVSHMSLMTDGIAFETNPTSQTLPADSGTVTVELTGIPRSNGKLDILGYTTHVLGVKNNCKLKDLTNAKKMKFPHMYTIDVVPPLPFIDIVCSDLETSNNSTTVSSDSLPVVSTFKLSLFAGELKTYTLSICNKSTNNEMVEIMSVSVQSKLPKNVECEVISWDDEALQCNLPLATDSSFNFKLTINGVSNFVRAANHQQQRKVSTSSAKFRASSGTASPLHSNYSSPAHKKSNNPNLLGAAFANFISDLQNGANLSNAVKRKHASEPSIIESLDEYPVKSVELMVNIEYSGGAGLTAGYCRKCALMFDIEILPSLIITQWDVLPAERQEIFDVLNATNQEMELFYATNKSILIEAKETCRIPVPVERCPLIDNEEKSTCISRDELHAKCKSYLNNQVHLKWLLISFSISTKIFFLFILTSNERSGTASIADIPWTSAMLDLILMSSLKWDVSVNEHMMPLTNEQSFYTIGQLISVNVKITNCSGNALRSLCVCLSCYQDFENGNRNYRLDMKRSVIGCDKVYIDEVCNNCSNTIVLLNFITLQVQITSKETYTHECSFIFLFTGLYKMDIQCTGLDHCAIDSTKNDDCLRVRSDSSSLKSQSLWKYSPSIEFNIVE